MSQKSLYLITGNDEYLVSSKAKEVVSALVPDQERALKLDVVDGSADTVDSALNAINQCISALQSLGLFSQEKVVWLQDASFLADNRQGKSEAVLDQVGRLTDLVKAGLSEGLVLVITAPQIDKRRAFYKACKAVGELHEFQMPEKAYQAERVTAERLDEQLAAAGLKMTPQARSAFLEKVGSDTRQLVNEVEKLAIYMGERTPVDIRDVRAVVSSSREAVAWDLADAFGNRDLSRAIATLRQLMFQKESTIGLVMGLESRVRDLLVYREAMERGWLVKQSGYGGRMSVGWGDVPPEVEQSFSEQMGSDPRKMHPFRVGVLAEQARNFSHKRLLFCLREVTNAHAKLVSSRVPAEIVLELLLVRMLATVKRKTR